MNFIILDCEWDTSYIYSANGRQPINEIIEIGALKLDEQLNEISRFSQLINPKYVKKFSNRFTELTKITADEVNSSGLNFEAAVEKYTSWAGDKTVTLTWSNSDLYTLFFNCKQMLHCNGIPFISKYADLQKYSQNYIAKSGNVIKNQISLEKAATMFNISFDENLLHRALDDASLCAEIFRIVYNPRDFNDFIVDTKNNNYYTKLTFKPFYIKNINSKDIDKKQLKFKCSVCGNAIDRISEWNFADFCFKADFFCSKCNKKFSGRVSFKKKYASVSIKKKLYDIK